MPKTHAYKLILQQLDALLSTETDPIANMANMAAVLFNGLADVNWAGFYILRGQALVLGPFQGKPACVRIAWGRGVCGTAAQTGHVQVVPDVHAFAGHIACDAASKSEIVLPILKENRIWGVLDIDSPELARFDETDKTYLTQAVQLFEKYTSL